MFIEVNGERVTDPQELTEVMTELMTDPAFEKELRKMVIGDPRVAHWSPTELYIFIEYGFYPKETRKVIEGWPAKATVEGWQDLTTKEFDDYTVDDLKYEMSKIREQTIALMANPYVDTTAIEWIVSGVNERIAGKQFAKVRPDVLARLNGSELKIYINNMMHQHTTNSWCTTSINTKAKETGLSSRQVYRLLNKMVKDNVLVKFKTRPYYRNDQPVQLPHWYRVNPANLWINRD